MVKLTALQLKQKTDFISNYVHGGVNASSASKLDANANVEYKNIATLSSEINKDINIQMNRAVIMGKLTEIFDQETADEYKRQIEAHEIYVHDESSIFPYCVAIDSSPFMTDGMIPIGGESKAPKHLYSYCGGYVNMIFAVSSQFAGAVADVNFLKNFHYFAKKDYGPDYLVTHTHEINNYLQHVIYTLNQPAAARGFQAVFYNTSIFDEHYFKAIVGSTPYPDMTYPDWEGFNKLQKFFMKWFNKERETALLTFPVITASLITEDGLPKDKEFQKFISEELAEGNSFFIYSSDSPDSLASCCRLRNDLSENEFSYTLGGVGVATGSKNVITLNMNRLIQEGRDLKVELAKVHKYQVAFEYWLQELLEADMLPIYSAGFIQLSKQFLTIGINGMVEAAEYLGIEVSNNDRYKDWLKANLGLIKAENKKASLKYSNETGFKIRYNTEFVPAENLGVKNYNWDKGDGFVVPSSRNCYNSYFYSVENNSVNLIDKFQMHGEDILQFLDGGSAYHLNLDSLPNAEAYSNIINIATKTGCNYFTTNIPNTICNDCGFISKNNLKSCEKCGSTKIEHATRVIGYLKKIKSFSEDRQVEASRRYYH